MGVNLRGFRWAVQMENFCFLLIYIRLASRSMEQDHHRSRFSHSTFSYKNSSYHRLDTETNASGRRTSTQLDSARPHPQCPRPPNPSTLPNWPFTYPFCSSRSSSSFATVSTVNRDGSIWLYSASLGSLALLWALQQRRTREMSVI